MTELLGTATLELNTDLGPLDVGLADAKTKVAKSVAEMQAMLDTLHGQVDAKMGVLDAALATSAGIGSADRAPGGARALETLAALEGVRGLAHPGSRANPIVVVLEAGRYTSLGALAAAVGENSMAGAGSSSSSSSTPLAPLVDSRGRTVLATTTADGRRRQATEDATALALAKLASVMAQPAAVKAGAPAKATPVVIADTDEKAARTAGDALAAALAGRAAGKSAPGNVAPGQFASAALADLYAAKGLSAALGPDLRIRVYGQGGVPGTHNFGIIPGAELPVAPGGRGGSGGGLPPWLAGVLWGHAGGGGGGGYKGAGTGLIGHALFGAAGLGAGFGSLGSFAGFGPEHIILTLGGIAGSGAAALGGGALLGAGALGKLGAGAGSDLLVGTSAAVDTKTLYADYEKLREAVSQYGRASTQAKEAQAELNATMKGALSGTPGVTAELHLAEKLSGLNVQWDKQTSGARVAFVHLAEPLVEIASKWIPLVNKAAEQNFGRTSTFIKPFFQWLKGPEAMGIFLQLESEFKNEIPAAMKALDQGFQFLAKTVAYTAPLTGKFVDDLDRFFTKMNEPGSFSKWSGEMNRLIADFHVWGAFLKELGGALVDLFDKDAHTGETIIQTLTGMLHKVREYENSVTGSAAIRNIFTVHKEEVIALLRLLPPLISGFSHIYTTVAPPLVRAVTGIANAFASLLSTIEKAGPLGTWALGMGLILAKLKLLVPLLKAAGIEMGILTGAAGAETGVAGAGAGAAGVTSADVLETLGVGGAGASLLGGGASSLLLKGGIGAVGGLLGGSLLAGAVGAHGTLGTSISTAGAGAGAGFMLGGPIGAGIGALIGAGTPYAIHFLDEVFSSHAPDYGRRFAEGFLAPMAGRLPAEVSAGYRKGIDQAVNAGRAKEREAIHPLHPAYGKIGGGMVSNAGVAAEAAREYAKAGQEAARAFAVGLEHERYIPRAMLENRMLEGLAALPSQARGAAAKAMLEYAAGLEANKTLPKGALAGMIRALEQQFPGLSSYLAQQGAGMAAQFAKTLELREARGRLTQAMDAIAAIFPVANTHTISGAEKMLSELNFVIAHAAGPMKESARALAAPLREAIETEWRLAKEVGTREIAALNAELRKELKELGSPEISLIGKGAPSGGVGGTPFSSPSGPPLKGALGGAAQGALFQIGAPGTAGHDTVPLNVGGLPIMVAPGEQVAVFNRHQLPIVNQALAGYGGLPGLFDSVSTPNYMASGGLIGQVVSAGLGDVRKAEHAKLARVKGAAAAHGGGGALGGTSFSGSWVQVMRGIAKEEGWGLADWEKVLAHESGGRVSVLSGGIGPAFGLGQLEPENYDKYGGGPGSSGVEQIIAMARYIKADYGNPTAAWASEVSRGIYARGGLPGFASGGIVGGPSSKARQALAGIWKAAAPHFRQSASSAMPSTQFLPVGPGGFESAPIIGTTTERPVGRRTTYVPDGFLSELGLPTWLSAILFEWVHHYQRHGALDAADSSPEGLRLARLLGMDPAQEGGAQAWLEAFGPGIFAKAGIAWPGSRAAGKSNLFYPAAQWLRSDYGSKWIADKQFGFAKGGLLGFASGGLPGFAAGGHFSTGSGPKKAKHLPKVQSWKVHPFGKIHPLATSWWGQGFYNQLNAALGESGSIAQLSEDYELSSTAAELALSAAPHEGAFIYTPGSQGNTPGTPEILSGNVELRQRQLEGLIGTENSLLGGMNSAWGLSSTVLQSIAEASAERAKAIRALQAKIKANLEQIRKHRETIERQKAELKKVPTGKHATAADRAKAKALEASIASEQKQIKALEAENVSLGGDGTSVGSGGRIGTYDTQVAELAQSRELVTGDRRTLGGVTGHGGTMVTAQQTLAKLGAELVAIGGPALALKLAEAGGGGESTTELLEREKAQLEEKLKIRTQEDLINTQALAVFGGPGDIGTGGRTAFAAAAARGGLFIPYGGSYAAGGVIPGPIGVPRAALVHGGEEVLRADQRTPAFVQHFTVNTLHPTDPATLAAIGKAATRGQRLQGARLRKTLRPGL